MAADESNYNGKKLTEMVDGVPLDHNEALWFGLTVAQVKERFYLDYVHSTGEDGTEGFIGGCYFGSANYEMHNSTRVGSLKVMAESSPGVWREYRLFWDGGLNTKGLALMPTVISAKIGEIKLGSTYKSAYFDGSTYHGIEYFQTGHWYIFYDWLTLPANTSVERLHTVPAIPGFFAGDTVPLRAYHKNIEGVFYSDQVSITLLASDPLVLKFNYTWPSLAFSGSYTETAYVDFLPLNTATNLYINSSLDLDPKLPAGYYVQGAKWYEVREITGGYMRIVETGDCVNGGYPSGDPGNSHPMPNVRIGYLLNNPEDPELNYYACLASPGTDEIYQNPSNGKWYRNWNSSTNLFTTLFTGYWQRNTDCQAERWVDGEWQYDIPVS